MPTLIIHFHACSSMRGEIYPRIPSPSASPSPSAMDIEHELSMEYYNPWTMANSELLTDAQEYDLQDNYGQDIEIVVSQNCRLVGR